MTTSRKRSQATGREGINFVRALVERKNSTFQEIDLHNDLGNDGYVEFVIEESATGCCVALQIKSGKSYKNESGRYRFQSDRDHFEYWSSHTLPVLAIIYDPEAGRACWTDISEHLRINSAVIQNGPYTIFADNDFSDATFSAFREHCLQYRLVYSRELNFGRALESFAARQDEERCFDGLKALFAFHRNQYSTWYYLISTLSNYKNHTILQSLVAVLCHVPGHGDIFWGKHNIFSEDIRQSVRKFMKERLTYEDAITLLTAIDDNGIQRGTIGQSVHALIDEMDQVSLVMEKIASDPTQEERIRHSAILIAIGSAQTESAESANAVLTRISKTISDQELNAVIEWLKEDLRKYGYVSIY
jgi:hypothetical protein